MKKLLIKLPHRRAIGLYLDGHEAHLVKVAITTLGPIALERKVESIENQKLETAIQKLAATFINDRKWKTAPLVLGLTPLSVFFSTRPIKTSSRESTAQSLLHEILKSSSLNIDDMAVDKVQRVNGKQTLVGLLACRKKILNPIMEALAEQGVRPFQVEPAPCGLLRLAEARHKTPRKAHTVLRIFLGEKSALAVLESELFPLLWRSSEIHAGDEKHALFALYRSVEKLANLSGADGGLDAVMIHGRPEVTGLETAPEWSAIKTPIYRYPGPGMTNDDITLGLALAGHAEEDSFNLARSVRPAPPIMSLVPWGQMMIQGAVLATAGMFLSSQLADLQTMRTALTAERESLPWLKNETIATLKTENTELKNRVEIIRDYLKNRIVWTNCANEFTEHLPADMTLSSMTGQCEYKPDAAGREPGIINKNSLTFAVDAPIAPGGSIPHEIEGFVESLRKTSLKKTLPVIEMGPLRWNSSGTNRTPTASFSVVCLPKAATPVPKAEAKASPTKK